ncbi:MAG: DUF4760 domain-containing protein [Propionibacteriaceae bacterium]|nr:DUF4760 domain-containing protein [Propionibacteriaceae bacterium]
MYTNTFDIRTVSGKQLPNDRDEDKIRELILSLMDPPADADPSVRRELSRTQAKIRNYLNHWEAIAVAVEHEVIDEGVIRALTQGRVRAIWANYRPYVEWRREITGSNTLWVELEWLAARWEGTVAG